MTWTGTLCCFRRVVILDSGQTRQELAISLHSTSRLTTSLPTALPEADGHSLNTGGKRGQGRGHVPVQAGLHHTSPTGLNFHCASQGVCSCKPQPVRAQLPTDAHLALMRYWARLMLAGVPVMVIWRSDDPSVALAILICAPDICRISLILVPWRPIMQPIS